MSFSVNNERSLSVCILHRISVIKSKISFSLFVCVSTSRTLYMIYKIMHASLILTNFLFHLQNINDLNNPSEQDHYKSKNFHHIRRHMLSNLYVCHYGIALMIYSDYYLIIHLIISNKNLQNHHQTVSHFK